MVGSEDAGTLRTGRTGGTGAVARFFYAKWGEINEVNNPSVRETCNMCGGGRGRGGCNRLFSLFS